MKKILPAIGVAALLMTVVCLSGCSETSEDTGAPGSSDDDIIPPSEPENATVIAQGFSGYIKLALTTPGVHYQTEGYLSSDIRIYIDDARIALGSGSYNFSTWQVGQLLTIKADENSVNFGLFGVGSDYIYDMDSHDYSVKVYIKGSPVFDDIVSVP